MDNNIIGECRHRFEQACRELGKTASLADRSRVYYTIVTETVDTLLRLPVSEQAKLIKPLRSDDLAFLRGISISGATEAVIANDKKWILLGLKGLCLEDFENDYRETIISCVQLQHSANKIDCDLTEFLSDIQAHFDLQVSSTIRDYVANPVQDLNSIRYCEGVDRNGQFTYIQNW